MDTLVRLAPGRHALVLLSGRAQALLMQNLRLAFDVATDQLLTCKLGDKVAEHIVQMD